MGKVGGENPRILASRGGVLRCGSLSSRASLPCQAGAPHHSRVARPHRGKRLTTRGPAFTAI